MFSNGVLFCPQTFLGSKSIFLLKPKEMTCVRASFVECLFRTDVFWP